jgi:hypothetical protein
VVSLIEGLGDGCPCRHRPIDSGWLNQSDSLLILFDGIRFHAFPDFIT